MPLLKVSGYDPVGLIEAQRPVRDNDNLRIFPFNHRSAGSAFTHACQTLGIVDLHLHDLATKGRAGCSKQASYSAGRLVPELAQCDIGGVVADGPADVQPRLPGNAG